MSDELQALVDDGPAHETDGAEGGVAVADGSSPSETEVAATDGRAERKSRQGIVISSKMQKTVVIRVDRSIRHPLYGRTVSRSRHFKAHDEHNECGVGDRVEIRETRPLSKEKRWRVARIIERAK